MSVEKLRLTIVGICSVLFILGVFYGGMYEMHFNAIEKGPIRANFTSVVRSASALKSVSNATNNIIDDTCNATEITSDQPSSPSNLSATNVSIKATEILSPESSATVTPTLPGPSAARTDINKSPTRISHDEPICPHNATNHVNKSVEPTLRPTLPHYHHQESNSSYEKLCTAPKKQLVFLKTHKTGSTSLASIFQRYGLYHDLTFALPSNRHFFQPVPELFHRNNMAQISDKYIGAFRGNTWGGYNFLTNHVRYNRPEMDSVVHNAAYVTILRAPVQQFESAFGYFELAKYIGLQKAKNPLELFMAKPQYYVSKKFTAWYWARNGQIWDLGFDHVHDDDTYTIQHKIKQLDFEFDLVMLTEYFDESLILLRKLMCWEWDDIMYLPKGIRSSSHRNKMSYALQEKIIKWNNADVAMYNHFNETLQRRIRDYGPSFESDLRFFRSKLQSLKEECIDGSNTNVKDAREVKTVLKPNASEFCRRVYRSDESNTEMIRHKMISTGFLKSPAPQAKPKVMKSYGKRKSNSRTRRSADLRT